MAVRIVLLRAVGVGPARFPMSELVTLAGELGATSARTYIATGNLVADVPGDSDAFDRGIEKGLQDRYGWFRDVISRSAADVAAALAAHPFEVLQPSYSFISFMKAAPTAAALETAQAVDGGDDVWRVIGRELHIRYAHGAGRPQLKDQVLLKRLGQVATARNVNTVRKLIQLAG